MPVISILSYHFGSHSLTCDPEVKPWLLERSKAIIVICKWHYLYYKPEKVNWKKPENLKKSTVK